MNGVPADHVARECNRVALGDEQAGSAGVDYSGVTSNSRAHKDARVADVNSLEKRGKEVVREFANVHDGQCNSPRQGADGWRALMSAPKKCQKNATLPIDRLEKPV